MDLNKIDNYFRFIVVSRSFSNKFLSFMYYKFKNKLFEDNNSLYNRRHLLHKEFNKNIKNKKFIKSD